jgi:AraC-like DNA-binding protein
MTKTIEVMQRIQLLERCEGFVPRDEVAKLGFADEDALAKAWKRWIGKTPREQRRNA